MSDVADGTNLFFGYGCAEDACNPCTPPDPEFRQVFVDRIFAGEASWFIDFSTSSNYPHDFATSGSPAIVKGAVMCSFSNGRLFTHWQTVYIDGGGGPGTQTNDFDLSFPARNISCTSNDGNYYFNADNQVGIFPYTITSSPDPVHFANHDPPVFIEDVYLTNEVDY